MARRKTTVDKHDRLINYRILLLLILVSAAYTRVASSGFVNWDDIVYIMNNPLIGKFDPGSLSSLFSEYFMGNYHPLTMVSFSFDYLFFNLDPAGYHIHNLLLHLVNTFLVYTFFFYLQRHNTWQALVIAMIFALHPMHVESVAWVSERKDLLYTGWFLLSLLFYLFYTKTEKKTHYSLALLFFFLSLMSKAQAVTLTPVLILLDIYLRRNPLKKVIAEKIPFLILSLGFGIMAVHAQEAMDAVNPAGLRPWQSFFYGSWGLLVYLVKFFVPFNQSALYHYPAVSPDTLPGYIWFSPVVIIILITIILLTNKRLGFIPFGILFFLVTIVPVLQFFPVGEAMLAERYTYLPYIGLIYAFTLSAEAGIDKLAGPNKNWISISGMAAIGLTLFMLTYSRTSVWANSQSLWTDVLRYNPRSVTAYINRSFIYNQEGLFEEAINDCNKGIEIDENAYKLYINRGFAYKSIQQYDRALSDFSKVIEIHPDAIDAYFDRGVVYTEHLGMHQLAVNDFKAFLQTRSGDLNGNLNLTVAFIRLDMADSALVYSKKSLSIAPEDPGACFLMAVTSEMKGDYTSAYTYGLKAHQKGYPVTSAQMMLWKNKADLVNR